MSMTANEAAALRIKEALGAHIMADAYRDTFPDDEQDEKYLRKQETYWRLKARQWMTTNDAELCHQKAKARAANEPEHRALVERIKAKLESK